MWSGVVGYRVPCLFSPGNKQFSGLIQLCLVAGMSREIGKLIGILVQVEQFFGRTRIGENLLLSGRGLTGCMGFP